jgi:low temperature requirement protein LtrA
MSVAQEPLEAANAEEEKRTGYLELFFDLVFVFAFTQVTSLVVEDTSATGLARAALVFALVWWAWSAYAWLTNAIDVDNVGTRLFVFAAMLAAFFVALAVPDAYTDEGVWFATAYFAARVLHVALYVWGARDDAVQRTAVLRLAPGSSSRRRSCSQAGSRTIRGARRCGRSRSRSTWSGRSSQRASASLWRTSSSATA